MQRAGFAAARLEGWTYDLLDVPPEQLADAVEALRDEAFAGANVTIPHKRSVLALVDAVEGAAERAGAVNTIRREGRRLVGSNTDVEAIRAAAASAGFAGGRVLVLGAGGSARSTAVALEGAELVFAARSPERAAGLPGDVVGWEDESWRRLAPEFDLLVNTTPLGRGGELPLEPELLPPALVDLVYVRGGTPLVRAARARGVRVVDGWEILLGQGARAFEAWTGRPAPLEAMRRTLEA
jgi:shikimate dehydrogenase